MSSYCLMFSKTSIFVVSFRASGKEPACQSRRYKRHGFDPWIGEIPGIGNGIPLQYSCLEKSMDRGACLAIVQVVEKSWL